MNKKILHKDIKKCFSKSKGRFFSILCLVALGSFALVGLQVAGPDMRKTGENYYNKFNLADISIIGDYGIDAENKNAINKISKADKIEYGYLKDVTVINTNKSIRIFSKTEEVSKYELVSGRMPKNESEIAIASFLKDDYKLNDTFEISEKADISGTSILKNHKFKIVGYVNSSELMNIINMGQSTAGTGELQGYAVVTNNAFNSDVYMMARILFNDTKGVDPYSDKYTKLISAHKEELNKLLVNQPKIRFESVKNEYRKKIDDGQKQIDDAKQELLNAEQKLKNGEKELSEAKKKYNIGITEYTANKKNAEEKLSSAEAQLNLAKNKILNVESTLKKKQKELNTAQTELLSARKALDEKWAEYNKNKADLEELKNLKNQLTAAQTELDKNIAETENALGMNIEQIENSLPLLKESLPQAQYEKVYAVVKAKNELTQKWENYNKLSVNSEKAEEQLVAAKTELDKKEEEYLKKETEIKAAENSLNGALTELEQKKLEYKEGLNKYNVNKVEADTKLKTAKEKLDEAEIKIYNSEKELIGGKEKYNSEKPKADKKIAEATEKISDVKDTLNNLKEPVYALDTRRETPGSEGYKVYGNVSNIVDSLASIFPIFLYFVAALVTLTTMTRFVDEERINSGTLKALGYSNKDIIKKFVIYGFAASVSGALIGIFAGHTLLPFIVYNAYGKSFTFPKIELHFYPVISVIALLLALFCTVLPAFLVANKDLREKPAALLQPKPPKEGSKILLEHIHFIWNRLNFTHKITARNIFRYKKRMLMTIFGVCGSVTLIFAGFSVQHSVSGIKDRQFGEIMKYDLIVAQNDGITQKQKQELNTLLSSNKINNHIPVFYEEVTKTAGKNEDKQSIKLIVSKKGEKVSDYIVLANRSTGENINLSDNGCVISERLAKLLNLKVGDSFTFNDSENKMQTVKVSGITEMYVGHFVFMNSNYYEKTFSKEFTPNANIVTLKDRSAVNAQTEAGKFMELDGVKGVVQNTTMMNQIDTVVKSLNSIMDILIVVAMLLAAVILYNLNNINVLERTRELSTLKVLGFYNKEVTLYIYRETILLTLLGIIVGYGFGDALFRYIIAVVPPEELMFNPALGAKAFIIPVIVVSFITLILGLTVSKRLKHIDMLEALKSVD